MAVVSTGKTAKKHTHTQRQIWIGGFIEHNRAYQKIRSYAYFLTLDFEVLLRKSQHEQSIRLPNYALTLNTYIHNMKQIDTWNN